MHHIRQTGNSCSVAALCVLNGLSQEDYTAVMQLIRAQNYKFVGRSNLINSIKTGIDVIQKLGYFVPEGYTQGKQYPPAENSPDLTGKGIIWIHGGKRVSHVVSYQDGLLYDTNHDKRDPETWMELKARYRARYPRTRIRIVENYKQPVDKSTH